MKGNSQSVATDLEIFIIRSRALSWNQELASNWSDSRRLRPACSCLALILPEAEAAADRSEPDWVAGRMDVARPRQSRTRWRGWPRTVTTRLGSMGRSRRTRMAEHSYGGHGRGLRLG